MKSTARTKSGARLEMVPRLERDRAEARRLVADVLTAVPDTHDFFIEEALNVV